MNSQNKMTNNNKNKSEINNYSSNSHLNHSNKTHIYSIKNSYFSKNYKSTKETPINHIKSNSNINHSNIKMNNLKNKFKSTKISPNKLLFNRENTKKSKYFNTKIVITKKNKNKISNNNKKSNKLNSNVINSNNNNKNQNINKIIIINKKSNEKCLIEEIFKKKFDRRKNKNNITKSHNNNVSLNNTSYNKNIKINSSDIIIPYLKINNLNNGNKFQKIKEHLINIEDDNKEKIGNENLNNTNYKSSNIILKNINSYKEKYPIKRIDFKTENHLKEKKKNYGQTSKNFYIMSNYISSLLSNQSQRLQNPYFCKSKKYNTITNKRILSKEKGQIYFSSNKKSTFNRNKYEINNKNKLQNKYLNRGENTILAKSNYNFKKMIKTSNTTKHNNRKESIDKKMKNKDLKVKTLQAKLGHPIRLSSENNTNLNQKITNKSISTNNYSNQNSELISKSNNFNNKKNDIDYHFVYNNYILNNNKKGLQHLKNPIKNKKIYSTKYSKEKINNKIILHKNNDLEKLFKNNKLNYRTHNCSKEEINFKRNLSFKFKTPRQNMKKINVNKNCIYDFKIKDIKISKNTPTQKNSFNNNNINNRAIDKYLGNNSKLEINRKNSFTKNKENTKANKINKQKLENIIEENKNIIKNDKFKIFKNNLKSNKDLKEIKNKEKEKEKDNIIIKNIQDKDLSDAEDDISLLNYLNNNIDNCNIVKILNESIDSINKDNNKYLSYNKSKEIISNYIKKYYIKHNKYPKTKMKFYKYGRLLGKGAYGKVNLCLHLLTGKLVAIKSINKSKITKERQRQKIKIETSIMKTLSDSNNIVKIYETFETKKHICIVMEYICAGDLLSYIKKRSKLTETIAKFIFKQIILALQYIHNHNIVHRDIKLDNILIDLDNNIKICDFGVSKKIKKDDVMVEQCGTPAYIAPEILKNRGYNGFGVDVWSAGVVLYAMLSGTVPFKGGDLKELHKLIIEGEYKSIKNISKEANHLIKCLLEVEPKNRIKIEDILVHPWMINVDLFFFRTQNLFTNAENILLAKSNVDYSDINNKENMVENFDIKNLDTENEDINRDIKTKSLILAPFNSSISIEEDEEENDFNSPDLVIENGIIKFTPKARDLNRNYELNNNQEIDNGIIILSNDSDEKGKKDKSLYDGSYNSKFHSKQFSPIGELENNSNDNTNNNIVNKRKNIIKEEILEKMQLLGYDKDYSKKTINNKEFNYATTTFKLLDKFFC